MYKILVVEDEEIERESIVALLKEYFFESLIVYSATNGLEALEIIKNENIQIVICDINMPKMNGLETIAQAKKINKDLISLILTSYNYFEYAREAIKLGVEDFILKPVSNEKMLNTIYQVINLIDSRESQKNQTTQLVKKIEEIKPIMESDCIHSIVQNSRANEIEKYFTLLNFLPKSGFCIVFQEESYQRALINQFIVEVEDLGCCCMIDSYYDVHILFVFSLASLSSQDIRRFEGLIIKYFYNLKHMGIGSVCQEYSEYYNSYSEAINNIGKPIKLQKYRQLDHRNYNLDNLCSNLINDLENLDTLNIQRKLNLFYLEILYFDWKNIFKVIWEFNEQMIAAFNQRFGFDIKITDNVYVIKLDEDPRNNLLENINDFIGVLVRKLENMDSKTSNILVNRAMEYIAANYNKPITLNSVADDLQVTPGYISNLLSNYTTKNFTDLITEYRIEKAKEMLKEDCQIKQIASNLGFGSHNYFSKVFKKVTGFTPKEYKNMFFK